MFEAASKLVNRAASLLSLLGQKTINSGWRLAVPGVCALCQGPGQWDRGRGGLDLCLHCEAALPRARSDGLTLAPGVPLLAPFDYRPPADFMIRQLKFAGDRSGARTLGLLLAEVRLGWCAPLPGLLVPVPLHWERLRERGFNQAAELARYAGRRLRIPVGACALRRIRPTQAQSGLAAAARPGNVRGCFAVRRPLPRGVHVALVDDVLTTGSTALEAVSCLAAAGAGRIEVWVACRAGRHDARGEVQAASRPNVSQTIAANTTSPK